MKERGCLSGTLRPFLLLYSCLTSSAEFATQKIVSHNVVGYTFNATVDHFSFRVPSPTFSLRYFVQEDLWNRSNGGPVFLYAGNEAPIDQFIKNSGFMFEIASEFGAMVVFAEHRYYGQSVPDPDNLSYLTVEQAMADFNTLTLHLRQKWHMLSSTAFIVFGGSYGANLALWLRLKNPNLWAGAIASSATPLKHLLRESNGFTLIETQVYANVSLVCPDLVREGWHDLYRLLEDDNDHDNSQQVAQALGLCDRQGLRADVLHGWISDALETLVQYGYPYPTDFYEPVPAYPFVEACHRMLQVGTGLGALRAAVDVFCNYTGQAGKCYHEGLVKEKSIRHWHRRGDWGRLSQTMTGPSAKSRKLDHPTYTLDEAWGYQTCTEVYQPMPTDGVTDFEVPYTPNRTEYFAECRERYGVQPRPNWEELVFMGPNIGSGTNIFLTNGQLDPWRAAGIQWQPIGSTDKTITIRTIENGAHHLDLRASHPKDPLSVTLVRQEQRLAIRRWMDEWREHSTTTKSNNGEVQQQQSNR